MADTKTLIERAYAAFNERNVDGALAFMSDDVSWPKASEGSKVVGKEAYWTRQWAAFDPHVERSRLKHNERAASENLLLFASLMRVQICQQVPRGRTAWLKRPRSKES